MAGTSSTERDTSVTQAYVLFAIAVVMLLLAVIFYCLQFGGQSISDVPANWGVLGDYFGGTLGPTFNLITLYLLVTNLRLQVKQMREAAEGASKAEQHMRAQYESALAQRFEQTFFSWLGSYRDIVDEIKAGGFNGREALKHLWGSTMNPSQIVSNAVRFAKMSEAEVTARLYNAPPLISSKDTFIADAIVANYRDMYEANKHQLDTMFRTLYKLVRWIDESDNSPEQKFDYVGIIQSQVSTIELQFLFMNAFTSQGTRFSPMMEQYAMLDSLHVSEDEVELIEILREKGAIVGQVKLGNFAFDADAARDFIETATSPRNPA